jgi:tRNA modification GTPase
MDLTQAEAVADLIHAKTDKAHQAALSQMNGRLADRIRQLRDRLLPLFAHVEVGLDHSDESHDFLDRQRLIERCQELKTSIAAILNSARLGKILRDGMRVTLVGRPNVGKSSLLNALLKEERAIVTPIAGTTRDTLEETINWDGIPVVLTDTAGLRENAADPIEQMGIERTRRAVAASDFIIGLFDGSEPLSEEDRRIVQECSTHPHVWVMNKADLPLQWDPAALGALNGGSPTISISAKTGKGLPTLVERLKTNALSGIPTSGEAEWLLNVRHQQALERAQEALGQAVAAAEQDRFEECVALELKTALQALGDIIGETATDDLLDQIFSQFCIGK